MTSKTDFSHAQSLSIIASPIESLATHLQNACLKARKTLFWRKNCGFNYNDGGGVAHYYIIKEENRVNALSAVQFNFGSHRYLSFKINGSDKIYHLTAANQYGNIKDENIEDCDKNNPYNKVADGVKKAMKEYREMVEDYDSISSMTLSESVLSEERLSTMSIEDMNEFAHIINNVFKSINVENLLYIPSREIISSWIETIFTSNDFKLKIDVDECSQLYLQLTSTYDEQRSNRLKSGENVAKGRLTLTDKTSVVKYIVDAFKNYKAEVKYYNNHNKEISNNKNIVTMKKNSKQQNNSASVSVIESIATSMLEVLAQVSALPATFTVGLNDWLNVTTNGLLSGTIENHKLTITLSNGIVANVPIAGLDDDNYRQSMKVSMIHLLEIADFNKMQTIQVVETAEAKANEQKGDKKMKKSTKKPSTSICVDQDFTPSDEIKTVFNTIFEKNKNKLHHHLHADNPSMRSVKQRAYWQLYDMGIQAGCNCKLSIETYREMLNKKNNDTLDELIAAA